MGPVSDWTEGGPALAGLMGQCLGLKMLEGCLDAEPPKLGLRRAGESGSLGPRFLGGTWLSQ